MKIALIGYGKMGKEIEKVALSRGHEIVSIIDINNQDDFESEAFKSADVAIEFTNPMVAYSNYMKAFKAGVKLVSGSTGWMAEHGDEVKELCNKGGKTLFWSSNFSLGVTIFSAVNKYLAKIMNQFPAYDVTMSETHHVHKLDAPSGTAITLAEGILENMERKSVWVKEEAHATNELPIHSIREGEVFGIEPPLFVELEITETEPGFAGNTATGATKPATVETGAQVLVPLFINQGEIIKIDTRTGEYLGRVNN